MVRKYPKMNPPLDGTGVEFNAVIPEAEVSFDVSIGHDHDGISSKTAIGASGGDMKKSDYDPDGDKVIALAQLDSTIVASQPPQATLKVTNIYYDPIVQKMVVVYKSD